MVWWLEDVIDSLSSYSLALIGWLMLGGVLCGWLLLDPRWEDQAREARRMSGLLTAAIGILAALIIVFAPLHTRTTTEPDPSTGRPDDTIETTTRASLWEQGLPPEFAIMLAVFTGVMIVVGRCAVPHGREDSREAIILLWIAAFTLLAAAAITILSVGLILVPVAALALVTAIHAVRARDEEDPESDQELEHNSVWSGGHSEL